MFGIVGASLQRLTSTYYADWTGNGVDRTGRTSLPLHGSARRVWVRASGSDANSGLSHTLPKATISAGVALIRDGYGDQLMVANDAAHTGSFGSMRTKRGLSVAYPTVIQSYDPADPTNEALYGYELAQCCTSATDATLLIGQQAGDYPSNNGQAINGPLVVRGINFDPPAQALPLSSSSAKYQISFSGGVNYLLFENCRMVHAQVSLFTSAPVLACVFRKCAIGYVANAFYANWYDSVKPTWVVEDCLNYHGGWMKLGTRDDTKYTGTVNANGLDHAFYFGEGPYDGTDGSATGGGEVVFRRNIVGHASAFGLQARSGGTVTENVFLSNPIHIALGGGSTYGQYVEGGVDGEVTKNYIANCQAIATGNKRQVGIQLANTKSGTKVRGNIIARRGLQDMTLEAYKGPFAFIGNTDTNPVFITLADLTDNIVYDWNRESNVLVDTVANITYTETYSTLDRSASGTNADSTAVTFIDSARDLLDYMNDALSWTPSAGTFIEQEGEALQYMLDNWGTQSLQPKFLASAIRPYLARGFNR